MASVCVRALSKSVVVYEWSVAAGVITGQSLTATPFSAVDRIQFLDPASPDPQTIRLEFSVYGGLPNAANLPSDISFRTRCFLTPQDEPSFATVELKLVAAGNDVKFSDAIVFGQHANVPHFPIAITDLTKVVFPYNAGARIF